MANQQSMILTASIKHPTLPLLIMDIPTLIPHISSTTNNCASRIPAPNNKRRNEKDRHSRDGRKYHKPGKGGKIRHGGYHHLDCDC